MSYAFPSDLAANLLRLAFLGLICLAALRRPRAADQALALGATALFWLPPVVWSHYFVLAFLPLFDLIMRAPRRLLVGAMIAYFLIATASLLYYVPNQSLALARVPPILGALVLMGTQVAAALHTPALPSEVDKTIT
jgi:hypothetical protein